jgi:hypothetical protein
MKRRYRGTRALRIVVEAGEIVITGCPQRRVIGEMARIERQIAETPTSMVG